MKRYIIMTILAAAFISCSDELTMTPAVSFFSEQPQINDDTAIFRLATAYMQDSTERIFPVTFSGTAEKGVDYTTSADAFVFGGESPVDSIVITTHKFGTGKTLNLSIELPQDVDGGMYLTSGFTLQDYPAYVSFTRDFGILADSTSVSVMLTDRDGTQKTLAEDVEISLIMDGEKSTAEEGTDFSIEGSSSFVIPAGKSTGRIKLANPEGSHTDGKDKVFFTMKHADKYGAGSIQEMEVSILESHWGTLQGRWDIDTLITDSLYMSKYWGEGYTGMEMFPKQGKYDYMEFDMTTCVFEPSFFSGMKYYFLDDSYFRNGPKIELDLGTGETENIQTFLIGNTNRYFSEELVSEDKDSYIGLQLLEGQPDTLSLYVIDYTSKSFMPELETEGRYAPEKPVAASPGLFINVRFTKQQ